MSDVSRLENATSRRHQDQGPDAALHGLPALPQLRQGVLGYDISFNRNPGRAWKNSSSSLKDFVGFAMGKQYQDKAENWGLERIGEIKSKISSRPTYPSAGMGSGTRAAAPKSEEGMRLPGRPVQGA